MAGTQKRRIDSSLYKGKDFLGISSVPAGVVISPVFAKRFRRLSALSLEIVGIEVADEMYILVSYDISTNSAAGKRRLRMAAKICLNYGQRVQNSVFECEVDEGQYLRLKHQLHEVIDESVDNLRFYRLGKHYKKTVESIGVDKRYDIEGPLIL